jgi:hypothetical protein
MRLNRTHGCLTINFMCSRRWLTWTRRSKRSGCCFAIYPARALLISLTRWTVVREVKPIPAAVPRLVGDAFNQLRSAIEHTVYAEVERQQGRRLTNEEGGRVEMPASRSASSFARWKVDRKRPELIAFDPDSEFVKRIAVLQPFMHSGDIDRHPLRVLVSHTNWSKHRAPAVAATHLGQVNPADHRPRSGLLIHPPVSEPLKGGEILASAPAYPVVELDVWATFSIQRPHSATWHIVMYELAYLETWVRETAIPTLITGTANVPAIRPGLNIAIGHQDFRSATALAGNLTAFERNSIALQAEGFARPGLEELLLKRARRSEHAAILWWINQLDDESAIRRFERLADAARDPESTHVALGEVRRIALRQYQVR